MEEGLSPEAFARDLEEEEDDFFSTLFSDLEPTDGREPEGETFKSLYRSDYEFYHHTLRRLAERHDFQMEHNPGEEVLVITRPPGFKGRERFLPREVLPEDNRYILTTCRKTIIDEIARCRKEESAWPKYHLLWRPPERMAQR